MVLSGQSPDGRLVEIVELADHPWFVASQFHPEFKSRPERPHPLFDGFVGASIAVAAGLEPEFRARPEAEPTPAEPDGTPIEAAQAPAAGTEAAAAETEAATRA
jgi:Glutamine amidotransferase class-I